MKNSILLSLLFLVSFHSISQNVIWSNVIGGQKEEYGNSIAIDPSGNIITTGCFTSNIVYGSNFAIVNAGLYDAFIQKLSSNGNVLWVRWYGGPNEDLGHSVATDSAGNIYMLGTFQGTVAFGIQNLSSGISKNYFLLKIDPDGNIIWRKVLPGSLSTIPKLSIDNANNLYVSGVFTGTQNFSTATFNVDNGHAYLLKLNSNNSNVIWATQFGSGVPVGAPTSGIIRLTTTNIDVDGSGDVYVTGCFQGSAVFGSNTVVASNSLINSYISKINNSGIFVWTKTYTGKTEGTSIVVDNYDNIYTAGRYSGQVAINNVTYTAPGDYFSIYFEKFNSDGQLLWFKNYEANTHNSLEGIPQLALDNDANILLKFLFGFGNSVNFEGSTYNYFVSSNPSVAKSQILATFDSNGQNTWTKQVENANNFFVDYPNLSSNMILNSDGIFFTNGSSKFDNVFYSGYSGSNAFTAKLSLPFLSKTNFDEGVNVSISPNPTSGIIQINFDKVYSEIEITTYNSVGQKVDLQKCSATQAIKFNLPAAIGIYLLDIKTEGRRFTKKVIKLN